MGSRTASKPACKFGRNCYRKNAEHLRNFSHDSDFPENEPKTAEPPESISSPKMKSPAKRKKITDFFASSQKKTDESPHCRKRSVDESIAIRKNTKTDISLGHLKRTSSEKCSPNAKNQRSMPTNSRMTDGIIESIKTKFSLHLNKDFVALWDYCFEKSPSSPSDALQDSLGLCLVGPYDIFGGEFEKHPSDETLFLHWRYFYDPPEMVTVLAEVERTGDGTRKASDSGFHIGLFRDDPNDRPVACVWNYAGLDGTLSLKGDNLFATIKLYADDLIRKKKCDEVKVKQEISDMASFLKKHELDFCLDPMSKSMKARDRKVVSKTFHGAGLVVPVVGDVGYRPLPESVSGLKKILGKIVAAKSQSDKLKAFEPLQEIVTLCQFANDEGDFGEGIELGVDLFTYGSEVFHPMISNVLPLGYQLTGRIHFSEVIEQHIANRRKVGEMID